AGILRIGADIGSIMPTAVTLRAIRLGHLHIQVRTFFEFNLRNDEDESKVFAALSKGLEEGCRLRAGRDRHFGFEPRSDPLCRASIFERLHNRAANLKEFFIPCE